MLCIKSFSLFLKKKQTCSQVFDNIGHQLETHQSNPLNSAVSVYGICRVILLWSECHMLCQCHCHIPKVHIVLRIQCKNSFQDSCMEFTVRGEMSKILYYLDKKPDQGRADAKKGQTILDKSWKVYARENRRGRLGWSLCWYMPFLFQAFLCRELC